MNAPAIPKGGPRSKREFDLPVKSAEECAHSKQIIDALKRRYPDAHCELDHSNAHELLIATILSAQATDVGVNKATPALFSQFPSPAAYAAARIEEIEPLVNTLNFWRNKSKAIHAAMTIVHEQHDDQVPSTMDELLKLRGVARKTANVVLGNAFGINDGVVVDTHVMRLSQRFGLTEHDDAPRIELDLMSLFPRPSWCLLSHLLIFHGRRVCKARGALCSQDAICRKYCSNA